MIINPYNRNNSLSNPSTNTLGSTNSTEMNIKKVNSQPIFYNNVIQNPYQQYYNINYMNASLQSNLSSINSTMYNNQYIFQQNNARVYYPQQAYYQ